MFWTNFVKLCSEKGEAPSVVAAKCGVKSTGTVSGWKKGAMPRESIINKLAEYLEVSVDEIKGDKTKKELAPEGVELTELQKEAVEFVLSLSNEQLRQLMRVGQAMIEK